MEKKNENRTSHPNQRRQETDGMFHPNRVINRNSDHRDSCRNAAARIEPGTANGIYTACRSNLKQYALGLASYTSENNEYLCYGYDGYSNSSGTFNHALYPYIFNRPLKLDGYSNTKPVNVKLYQCPAAKYKHVYYTLMSSYGYNYSGVISTSPTQRILGYKSSTENNPPTKTGQIKQPSAVFFFGDGRLNITSNLWGDNPAYPNNAPGSDPSEFVPWRHQKQVNILYGDGHAASRRVSPEIRVTTNEGKLFWNGQQ